MDCILTPDRENSIHLRHLRTGSHNFFRHGFLVLAATSAANMGAFLFHAFVSRTLGAANYGSLYALISFAQVASLPAGIFATVVAKFAAEFSALDDLARLRALSTSTFAVFSIAVLLYIGGGIVLGPAIGHYLRVPAWAAVLAAAMAGCTLLASTLRAIPQGTQDFNSFSAALIFDGGSKAGAGGVLALGKFGLAGGLIGFFAGTILSAAFIAWRLWLTYALAPRSHLHVDWRRVLFTIIGAASLTAAITIMSYGDVIVVKHFFSPEEAGIYAAASLGGKILFFLVGFAPAVLIPKATDRDSRGQSSTAALGAAVLMVGVLTAVGLLGFFFGANLILRALVGGGYGTAAILLPWYGVAMSLLALTNVVASYSVALHRFAFSVPLLIAAVVEIISIIVYHPDLSRVVATVVASNALGLVVVVMSLALQSATGAKNFRIR